MQAGEILFICERESRHDIPFLYDRIEILDTAMRRGILSWYIIFPVVIFPVAIYFCLCYCFNICIVEKIQLIE